MQLQKLLYIHTCSVQSTNTGGLNTTLLQVFSMCNAFSKAGYIVVLAMEGDAHFTENLKVFIENSFKDKILFDVTYWQRACKKRFLNRILVKHKIIGIAKKQKPALIFTREPFILSGLVKMDIPVIFESHNNKLHNRINFIHRYLKNMIIKTSKSNNFKCLFSISEALSNYWEQNGISGEKLFSWHDGFDTTLFEECLDKNESREKLNLPKKKTIVTYTGGLYPDRVIDNIIFLAKAFPDTFFIIIGGPEKNRQYYESMARENNVNNIHFHGFVKHKSIPQYLYASDVLLALWSSEVPTINYCSPLKLFEYMAAGRVILAHSFPTIKEVLVDGKDAIFCHPDTFDSMKSGLKIAINASKKNQLGKNARDKAFNLYSWDTRVDKLFDFLKSKNFM